MKDRAKYSQNSKNPISETPTLSEFEEYIRRGIKETLYYSIDPVTQEIADAQEYVRPFENGIFVPTVQTDVRHYYPEEVLYRRYAGGYPTNESVLITPKGVTYSGEKFTDEDLMALPDLARGLELVQQNFDAGLITPGHIKNWEEMKFISHSIFGWYDKTDDGVYGVIRVSWCYHGYREDGYFDVFRDDQYFLVALGSDDLQPIEHQELIDMGGGDWHFMPGRNGYNEYGRKSTVYAYY